MVFVDNFIMNHYECMYVCMIFHEWKVQLRMYVLNDDVICNLTKNSQV